MQAYDEGFSLPQLLIQPVFLHLDLLQLTLHIHNLLLQHSSLQRKPLISTFPLYMLLLLQVCMCDSQLLLVRQTFPLLQQLLVAAAPTSVGLQLILQSVDMHLVCCTCFGCPFQLCLQVVVDQHSICQLLLHSLSSINCSCMCALTAAELVFERDHLLLELSAFVIGSS